MTSEIDNILRGVVTKSINFDEDKRVIGLGTQTITPTQNGPAPLSKQNAFIVEQTLNESIGTETLDNDVSAVPILPQKEEASVEEMPVNTADLSSLGSIHSDVPAEEKLEEHVEDISSGLAPIFDTFESDKKQEAPVGIELPKIDEVPLAQEPTSDINMNLFNPISKLDSKPAEAAPINQMSVEPAPVSDFEPIYDKIENIQVTNNNQSESNYPLDNDPSLETQQANQTQEDLEIKFMAELNIEAKKMVDIIKSYVDAAVEKKVAEALKSKENDMNNTYLDEGPKMSL